MAVLKRHNPISSKFNALKKLFLLQDIQTEMMFGFPASVPKKIQLFTFNKKEQKQAFQQQGCQFLDPGNEEKFFGLFLPGYCYPLSKQGILFVYLANGVKFSKFKTISLGTRQFFYHFLKSWEKKGIANRCV